MEMNTSLSRARCLFCFPFTTTAPQFIRCCPRVRASTFRVNAICASFERNGSQFAGVIDFEDVIKVFQLRFSSNTNSETDRFVENFGNIKSTVVSLQDQADEKLMYYTTVSKLLPDVITLKEY